MSESPWGINRLQEEAKKISEKQLEALERECQIYAQCFGTDAGKKILEIIKDLLEKQPTWNPEMDAKYGYYREGQNDVLRHIINRVNFARKK